MRIIRESTLQKMIKEAYEDGLNLRKQIDAQTKRRDNRGIILSGYDMDKDLREFLKRR